MLSYIAKSDNCSIYIRLTSFHISGSNVAEWAKRLDKVICHVLSRTEGMGSNPVTRQQNLSAIFYYFGFRFHFRNSYSDITAILDF